MTTPAFLLLSAPAQRAHLRMLARVAQRTDVTRGAVQGAIDELVRLCAALPGGEQHADD